MAIERKLDNLGRVVLPKEMRDKLGLEDNEMVSITREDDSIIIKNYKEMKARKEIKERLEHHKQSNTDYYRGYKDALKWVLNEK
jgi:transcriptional pleiotropic regulator of transition state genes